MSLEQPSPGITLKDNLLQLAETIVQTEYGVDLGRGENGGYTWNPEPAIIAAPIALPVIKVKGIIRPGKAIQVERAVFSIEGGERTATVDRDPACVIPDDDWYALDVLEAFQVYYGHPHRLCMDAMRHPASKPIPLGSSEKLPESSSEPESFTTVDKRHDSKLT